MFYDTHILSSASLKIEEDKVIKDIIQKDTGFNRKYDETLFC